MKTRNFVLIPGAWLGEWVWTKIVHMLRRDGHEAYPLSLTGMGEKVHLASPEIGIETHIQDVANAIEYNDLKEVVLVGHSYAGKVACAAADRSPERISTIIYLDAFRPEKIREPQGEIYPDEYGEIKPDQWSIPFSEKILEMLGRDVVGADREWMLSKGTPWLLRPVREPITLSSKIDSITSVNIFCTMGSDADYLDDILSGKWGKIEGPSEVIDTGHWPMVTKPDVLVEAMLSLLAGR